MKALDTPGHGMATAAAGVLTTMTTTQQSGGASPVDFAAFGDYGDFRPKQPQPAAGEFVRPAYPFRGRITADGSSGYPAVAGRYHLYLSWACPRAHRTAIVRSLLGLEEVISRTCTLRPCGRRSTRSTRSSTRP